MARKWRYHKNFKKMICKDCKTQLMPYEAIYCQECLLQEDQDERKKNSEDEEFYAKFLDKIKNLWR